MEQFDIPVCLFMFQRKDTILRIIDRISKVKPRRIYLMCDQGRNDEEKKLRLQLTKCPNLSDKLTFTVPRHAIKFLESVK